MGKGSFIAIALVFMSCARACKSKRSCVFGAHTHSAVWRGAAARAARARLRERVQMGPLREGAELAV